jgi:hypothetical protein
LLSDFKAVAKRLQSDSMRLQSDFDVILKLLRMDSKAIAKLLQSYCKAIESDFNRMQSDCKAIAK